MRRATLLLMSVVLCYTVPQTAAAETQTASAHLTEATFSFTHVPEPLESRDLRLTIKRGGVPLVDSAPSVRGCDEPSCHPGGGQDSKSVRVTDLDADGEPEVLLDLYTGGAHCCYVTNVYRFTGAGYAEAQHDWRDVGYRLKDLNGDQRPEFVSADARFAYRFASFASSLFPLRVFAYDAGVLRDVTRSFPADISKDARGHWTRYRRLRGSAAKEPLGALAAWVADQYLLGKRESTLRLLRRLARRGELKAARPYRSGSRFVTDVDGFLRRLGYAPEVGTAPPAPATNQNDPFISKSEALSEARSALRETFGGAYRAGYGHTLVCRRAARSRFNCRLSWNVGDLEYSGRLTVGPSGTRGSVRVFNGFNGTTRTVRVDRP
jgi:hypothetical protein